LAAASSVCYLTWCCLVIVSIAVTETAAKTLTVSIGTFTR